MKTGGAPTLVGSRIGYDVTGFPLDGPVPAPPSGGGSQAFSRVLYETARRENMTLRDLYNLTAAARGHWVLCGTPKHIADTLEEWGVSTRGRRCVTTSGCHACRRQRDPSDTSAHGPERLLNR